MAGMNPATVIREFVKSDLAKSTTCEQADQRSEQTCVEIF